MKGSGREYYCYICKKKPEIVECVVDGEVKRLTFDWTVVSPDVIVCPDCLEPAGKIGVLPDVHIKGMFPRVKHGK